MTPIIHFGSKMRLPNGADLPAHELLEWAVGQEFWIQDARPEKFWWKAVRRDHTTDGRPWIELAETRSDDSWNA